jgi:chromosome segregation ATPase
MKNFRARWVALLFAGAILGAISGGVYRNGAEARSEAQPQDTFGLERRISSLEQRFYTIELSINRLEQQSMMNSRSAPSTDRREVELDLLQNQIRTLQGQLSEIGCGLLKLDERTLSASVRQARSRNSRASTDPCRLNPETPLLLSPGQ